MGKKVHIIVSGVLSSALMIYPAFSGVIIQGDVVGVPGTSTSLIIGDVGDGSLEVNAGSNLTTVDGSVVGDQEGSTGTATVTDAGSVWTVGGGVFFSPLSIGRSGTGVVELTDNANITILGSSSAPFFEARLRLGLNTTGDGALVISNGASLLLSSTTNVGGEAGVQVSGASGAPGGLARLDVMAGLRNAGGDLVFEGTISFFAVGRNGAASHGEVNVAGNSLIAMNATDENTITIGTDGATGIVSVYNNSAIEMEEDAFIAVGRDSVGSNSIGTLIIRNQSLVRVGTMGSDASGNVIAAQAGNSEGVIQIEDSELLLRGSAPFFELARDSQSRATFSISGPDSLLEVVGDTSPDGFMIIGRAGRVDVSIGNGSTVLTDSAVVARDAGSNVNITIFGSGSILIANDTLELGRNGQCKIKMSRGAIIAAPTIIVGPNCKILGRGTLQTNSLINNGKVVGSVIVEPF